MWEPPLGFKAASVSVLVAYDQDDWWMLFIKRPSWMKEHPLEMGFPGGKREAGDESLWETAMRETEEEVGILLTATQCLGCLTPVVVKASKYWIWPWLVATSHKVALTPNPQEVTEAVWISWRDLRAGCYKGPYGIAYRSDIGTIWGATARIIQQLLPYA
ncbi:NUDIX hydrolase [Sulfobacillus thermosulfidooxidans]|uniref:NUDIX hydrolase n=1 Tax=Sulfobacillus thermosulfidooxidans TaxID=28034 RepID=UPI0006B4BBB8|nr:CoA pyrophosphatase [Sulfobacillus thermosulfidooxidans]